MSATSLSTRSSSSACSPGGGVCQAVFERFDRKLERLVVGGSPPAATAGGLDVSYVDDLRHGGADVT
jgi:hypothetical protein